MAVNVNGGALTFDAWVNNSQFKAQIDEMERRLKGLTDRANEESQAIEAVAEKAATAIGAYLSISSATDFIKKMIEVRGEFQQLEVAFTTMLQSKEKADQLLADVARLAANTPFGLQDAAQGTKQLLAYGFQAEEITKTLTMLGNVASGVSAPLNDIVYLYGTLKTQGRAYSQDIKQFTGRGIPIIQKLAEQFGVSADKVNDLVGAGKVGFPEIEKAFSSMTQEGGMFFNLMEEQSKTLTGRISNLEDAFMLMLNNMGKSSEGVAYTAISALTTLVENYQQILNILEILIATYGTYRAAVIAVNVVDGIRAALIGVNTAGLGAMTVAEYLHYQALVITEKAQKLLNATMLSNPYVAIATALAALTATLLVYHEEAIKVKDSQELLKEAYDKVSTSVDSQTAKMRPYISILQSANSTEKERLKAYEKLAEIDKKIVEGLDAKAISQQKLTENVNLYIEALRNKLKLEANQSALTASLKIEEALQKQISEITAKRDAVTGNDRRAQQYRDTYKFQIDELTERLKNQQKSSNELAEIQVKDEAKKVDAIVRTNAELIAQAKSLDELASIRKDIDEKYEQASTKAEREALARDKRLADSKKKELDIYEKSKREATGAIKENNKLKALLEKITELETKATSVTDGKEEGSVAKITAEVEKLSKAAEALNASEGVKLRIQRAGQILIDDATAKAAAKDIENKLNTELSNINVRIAATEANSAIELELRKAAIDAEANLQAEALKQQYSNDVSSQLALQSKISEIQAQARRQKLGLDKEFARRSADAQIAAINRQLDRSNIADQAILNDPTATAAQRFEAQQNILKRSKKALEDMKSVLYNLKLSGKGDIKEINIEIENLNNNIKEINNQLSNNTKTRLIEVFLSIKDILQAAGNDMAALADSISTINPALSEAFRGISALLRESDKLIKLFDGSIKTTEDKITTGVQAIVSLTTMVINAAAERARVESEFNQGLINQQNEYNLALNEAIRLNAKLQDNVFVTDTQQQLRDGINALTDAQTKYQEAIKALSKGQAIAGKRNTISGSAILSGVGTGAVAGAAIGSIVPVIGNAVGAVVGAVVGGIVGLFGGKKKKDSYVALLQEYPELVRQTDDGVLEINKDLAKTLINNKLVSDATRVLIQDTLDWQEAIDKANEQIRSIITDLAGNLGSDLRDSLVSAFEAGTDSAKAFAESVEKTLQNVVSQMIFNNIFGSAFDALQEQMQDSFAPGGDMSWQDDLTDFFTQYSGLTNQFNEQLAAAQQAAENVGLSIFKNKNDDAANNSLQGAIQSMSEQTAEVLAGQLGAMRLNGAQQLQVMTQNLSVLNAIKSDTAFLSSIDGRLRLLETQGIKIRS